MKMPFYYVIMLLLNFATITNAQKLPALKVGDKAPELFISKWLQGEPVKSFQKDHLYVVEFTATWCGPCIKAMPHLSKLAKQYKGEVSFISIFTKAVVKPEVHEDLVTKLIAEKDRNSSLIVALDDTTQKTADHWGITGVPRVFIVDRQGVIVWDGNPLLGLDKVLDQMIKGNYDSKVAIKEQQNYQAIINLIEKLEKTDYRKAVSLVDSLLLVYPDYPGLYPRKYELLAGNNDPQAKTWLNWMLDHGPEGIIWINVCTKTFIYPNPDYQLSLKVIKKAEQDLPEHMRTYIYTCTANMYLVKSRAVKTEKESREALQEAIKAYKQGIAYCKMYHPERTPPHFQQQITKLELQLNK